MTNDFILNNYQDIFNKKDRKIEIPKRIRFIYDYAFANNNKVKKISIHEAISKIGPSAFEECTNLEEIKFRGYSELVVIPEKCFSGCKSLISFEIPQEVGVIKKYAFKGCTSIERIVIPESVIAIEAGAFDLWTENQTIEIYRNFKFGMVCKAKIINHSLSNDEIQEDDIYETIDGRYMYAVQCKCGHVGRHRYMPIEFPVIAINKKEAAKIARQIPRVKHDHKDAILNVRQVSEREFKEINEINNCNPYLKINSKHQQKEINDYIDEHAVDETNYIRRD